ncbi:hypothetical protein DHEL01_v207336 [Diaporthe helianthi]|uniref:Uncharacterized protein n=1 Tax=Diaporthe helianthi TaxID=158607 RepID=A0A2P5HVJ4_DIAHE|nr:hypothetical protein DHEL01_v207336 [Diaporthe helianthi]
MICPPDSTLPPLQATIAEHPAGLEPLGEEEVEPGSFDLVSPKTEHSESALAIAGSLLLPHYYLDTVKALAAFRYANAINEALELLDEYDFTRDTDAVLKPSYDRLEGKADAAFALLAQEDLPAFITSTGMQFVEIYPSLDTSAGEACKLRGGVPLAPLALSQCSPGWNRQD